MTDDVIDLVQVSKELLVQAADSSAGRASKSLLHGEHQRAVLIALTAGNELAEHDSPLAATLQVLTGRCRLTAGEKKWLLGSAEIVPIPPERHAVEALDDCVILLTVSL